MQSNHLKRDAFLRFISVSPIELWPKKMKDILFGKRTITHSERLIVCSFLYGNGSNKDDIKLLISHLLRDKSAVMDVHNTLDKMTKNPKHYFYYDVNRRDTLDMNGEPYGVAFGNMFDIRKLNEWDKFCSRHKVTLAMQEGFFAQTDTIYPHIHFSK